MGKLPVPVAVNMGRLPLTREKHVGYRVERLRHYHIWEIMVAFQTTKWQTSLPTRTRRQK